MIKDLIISPLRGLMACVCLFAVPAMAESVSCGTWSEVKNALTAGNDAKLTGNLTADSALELTAGAVGLDLNGFTVTYGTSSYLIKITNAALTISDSGSSGCIDGGGIFRGIDGFIQVGSNAKCILQGGTVKRFQGYSGSAFGVAQTGLLEIRGGAIQSCDAYYGGAVSVKGELILSGGTIANCWAQNDGGAVIVESDGRFVFSGGSIEACQAAYGGGVKSRGVCEMSGGTISGCTASQSAGGIESAGSLTVSGGTITGCSADYGGGIYAYGTGTFADGKVAKCSSTTMGGAICLAAADAMTVTGGLFRDNSCFKSSDYANFGQRVVTVRGGVFNNWSSVNTSVPSGMTAVKCTAFTIVGENPVLDGDTIQSGSFTFDPMGKTYEGMELVDTETTTVTKSADRWVVSTPHPIVYVECSTWTQLKNALSNGQSAKLLCDITQDGETAYLDAAGSQTLNLNGFTLKRKASKYLIVTKNGNSLKIKGGGTIDGTADYLVDSGGGGGCVYVQGGTLILQGGVLKGRHNSVGGGVGVVGGGTFEMRGGSLELCSAKTSGGAVWVDADSFFVMSGGTINSCHAEGGQGGGVCAYGRVTITGGSIVGCKASGSSGCGGGLYASENACTVSGAVFQDNTAAAYGGAVALYSSSATFDGCTLRKNTATYGGGGCKVSGSSLMLSSCTLADNSVTVGESGVWGYSGGGVQISEEGGSCVLDGGTVSGSTAPVGAGVAVLAKSTFQMKGGRIRDNRATGTNGGGIAIELGGTAVVTGGEISGNESKGAGAGIMAGGSYQMTGGVVKGNMFGSVEDAIRCSGKSSTNVISGGVVLGSFTLDGPPVLSISGGVFSADVGGQAASGWKQYDCNGRKVFAQNHAASSEYAFTLKDDAINSGVFAFDVSEDIYADHGVSIESTRAIKEGGDGLWYVTAPPELYVNGVAIGTGSGTGWTFSHGVVSLVSAMPYRLSGVGLGASVGFVVSANATVELSGLALTVGNSSRPPLRFASGATAAYLLLTGDNTVSAGNHAAVQVDAGTFVSLDGTGSLSGDSGSSARGGIAVKGSLAMTGGTIADYNSDQDGGGICVSAGGVFDWSGGEILDCSAVNGGAIYNAGTATLTNRVLTGLAATENGGAIYNAGTLDLACCRFEKNTAKVDGGAIFAGTGQVTVRSSSFNGNEAKGNGGTLAGSGSIFMLNSTVINGYAKGAGGGYHLDTGAGQAGDNRFVNCTFRSNSAGAAGGGICADASGKLTLLNVLLVGNVGSSDSDLHLGSASVSARGVVAAKSNMTGGIDCTVDAGITQPKVFAVTRTGATKLRIGDSEQYVETLKLDTANPACKGHQNADYPADITGRVFDRCQSGSCWRLFDNPSLTVSGLDDTEDSGDGVVTLREILTGIATRNERYTALAEDGVYKISFKSGLAGELKLEKVQMDVVNTDGRRIEIDGGTAGGGRLTICCATNAAHRAFSVYPKNELRLRNIDFKYQVGETASQTALETRDGGALSNRGILTVEDCTFTACSAGLSFANPTGYGGAIANGSDNGSGATATVSRCSFTACRAAKGGAIYNFDGNTIDITASSFTSNCVGGGSAVMVADGGAIFNEPDGTLSYADTSFEGNSAILDGKLKSSDVGGKDVALPHFVVTAAGGKLKVALSSAAAPELSGEEAAIDLTSSADEVTVVPENVKPFLYYGLGRADTPGGDYTVESWVQADANGRLPQALAAPKAGTSGFYKVMVKMGE